MFHVKHQKITEHGNIPNTPLLREMTLNNERSRRVAEVTLTPPSKTRIITISNQKGGVGKTTSAVNLAAALARKGMGVLVIDLDPQGNASTALGVEHHNSVVGSYEVLVQGVPMLDAVKQSPEHHNLYCLPATINLDRQKALGWLNKGAAPTDTVRRLLSFKGVLYLKHLLRGVDLGLFDHATAMTKFEAWHQEQEAKGRARYEAAARERRQRRTPAPAPRAPKPAPQQEQTEEPSAE